MAEHDDHHDGDGDTLTPGQVYDWRALVLVGWTVGDGSGSEGYALEHYFNTGGHYLGPDAHGIEPRVVRADRQPGRAPSQSTFTIDRSCRRVPSRHDQ
jgi:hypothetical protein